jgi:alpha-1,3-rhamnosyl/mannosyltransferase
MLGGLLETGGDEHELLAFAVASPRGRRAIEAALEGLGLQRRVVVVPPPSQPWRTGWSSLGRPALERLLGRFDVLHFSDWLYPPQLSGVRATSVYDLVPLRFPEWTTLKTQRLHVRKVRHAARTCDVLFAISRQVAVEVKERLGVDGARLEVAYPGVGEEFRPNGAAAELPAPYLLAVSTLEPRKNVGVLVEAFSALRAGRPELTLAVAGPEGWGKRPDFERPGVLTLGFVPDSELPSLYRGASAFVYPSRYEGFGLPVLEAMACGTPAAVSSHPSLDEVSGDAAFRADPDDPQALAGAIERALEDDGSAVERGKAHAAGFTWARCGQTLLEGYRARL